MWNQPSFSLSYSCRASIVALERWRQENQEFKVIPGYKVSSSPIQTNETPSQNKNKNKTTPKTKPKKKARELQADDSA